MANENKTVIELSSEELNALTSTLSYMKRKTLKSEYWREQLAPLMGLIRRLEGGLKVVHVSAADQDG